MHTFLLFFGYPNGGIWGNVYAMPVCAVIAGVVTFIFRDHIGRAVKGWWHRHLGHKDDLEEIHARLDAHADLLDPLTPGGLAVVLSEVRDARAAAESAKATAESSAAEVRALVKVVAPTQMKRTAGGRSAAKSSSEDKT